jgi:HAD superfamily hydrolase (TIGR01450 family)
MSPSLTSMRHLIDAYDGILLDAYGVLVDVQGPLPGACDLIATLERSRKPYAICSNDASRLPATYATRFANAGLPIPVERITSAGQLLYGYFAGHKLAGARVAVLGTADAAAFVTAAGGHVLPLRPGMEIDVLTICDDDGFDFKEGLDIAMSAVARAVAGDRAVRMVLPNPDLIYPKREDEFGFTAGGMAAMIEAGLARRFPDRLLRFDRLGKPAPDLLWFAQARVLGGIPAHRLVMIGDQMETDIIAARAAGMDSALVDGVSQWRYVSARSKPADGVALDSHDLGGALAAPTYLLRSVTP